MKAACLPVISSCDPISSIGHSITEAFLHELALLIEGTASWLTSHVLELVARSGSIDVTAGWFQGEFGSMDTVAAVLLVPLLLAGTTSAVLHQDLHRLARTWLVGLPLAVFGTLFTVSATNWALGVADLMTGIVLRGAKVDSYQDLVEVWVVTRLPPSIAVAMAAVIVLAALMLWLELVVRSAAVYVAVFFLPLAFAGLVWPATAHLARRMVEMLATLVLAKFVIVAALVLGAVAVQSGHGVDQVATGVAILLIAAFAPFVLLRMVPVVEAASVAHLAGLSRQPFQAVRRAQATAQGALGSAGQAISALHTSSPAQDVGAPEERGPRAEQGSFVPLATVGSASSERGSAGSRPPDEEERSSEPPS